MWKYRPLSPHITVYSTENSSLYSILHRVSGMVNSIFIIFFIVIYKLYVWGMILSNLFILDFIYYVLNFLLWSVFYHLLNGWRHLNWDLNKFLTTRQILKSSIVLFLLLIFLNNISWILIF